MVSFSYTATDNSGKITRGKIEAINRTQASDQLTKQGYSPSSIIAGDTSKSKGLFKKKVKLTDLVLFTRQLATMVDAGVPLLRALVTLKDQVENKTFKEIIEEICKDVEGGMQLADSLEKHPDVFSDIYVNMVRAGESAGIVDDVLKRLATQEEKTSSMHKKIKSASTYPLVLLVITVVAFFGLMLFVIPNIGKIMLDIGGPDAKLPLVTEIMLDISSFTVKYWYIVLGISFVVIYIIKKYISTETGKLKFHQLILKIPIINTLVMKIAVSRFTRTFAALISAGVSVVEALRVTSHALGNKVFEQEVLNATQKVINGQPLSQAIENGGLFPAIVPQMLAIGEETGQTGEVLIKVADFYDEEVDATIDSLSSILEPVMIVIMGGAVGLIAISVMGPIANLSTSIGG
ncbi:type II secretion system F family protein [Candidatus Saccharibacteria bacterium]|nr:type II secretion system F family protein [Candidatus Saccharibacteria bacterium]NCU40586.1 type II secretion system F family protein [Candidatus Saccharibacteria bacterium]